VDDSLRPLAVFTRTRSSRWPRPEVFLPVANCNVAVREWNEEIIFLHKILPGAADKSYGIQVARLAGLPKPVVERAKSILSHLELNSTKPEAKKAGPKAKNTAQETLPQAIPPQLDLFGSFS
jgi:DNA mismatch repair protein MutS